MIKIRYFTMWIIFCPYQNWNIKVRFEQSDIYMKFTDTDIGSWMQFNGFCQFSLHKFFRKKGTKTVLHTLLKVAIIENSMASNLPSEASTSPPETRISPTRASTSNSPTKVSAEILTKKGLLLYHDRTKNWAIFYQ
jgi:hypothetical protein